MALGGVVQVGQSGEVGELTGGLVVIVVLAQDFDGLGEVVLVGILGHIVVADKTVVVAGVLVELGAVSVGHTHGNEGGSGKLTALGDLVDDVVPVEQQADGSADFRLSQSLFFGGHFGGCFGSGLGRSSSGGSGSVRLGAASNHAQNHNSSQKQCNEFLHFSFSFLNDEIYLQTPIGI